MPVTDTTALPPDLRLYAAPAEYVDSDHPAVQEYAARVSEGAATADEWAQRLYAAVRDDIIYNPYVDYGSPETYRASSVLRAGNGYCVGKASLYAALCRSVGIPARVGLADVQNHLATPRLMELVGDNVFRWHGYVEVYLGGRWVKVTPTFNRSLCDKLGVVPLEFDGRSDALLQAFDGEGRTFMEYLADHGTFADVPAKFLIQDMARLYPRLCAGATPAPQGMENDIGVRTA